MRTYAEYLRSAHWQRLRVLYRHKHEWRCAGCNTTEEPLDLHHKTYERLGHEQLSDLAPLCRRCHELLHALHRQRKATLNPKSLRTPTEPKPFVAPPFTPIRPQPMFGRAISAEERGARRAVRTREIRAKAKATIARKQTAALRAAAKRYEARP